MSTLLGIACLIPVHINHFFSDLAWSMLGVLAIYMVGFAIESGGRICDAPNRKAVLLNSALALVLIAANLSIGVMTAYYLKLLVDITGYKAPIHFRSVASEVFALSFLAVATNDFFYYWFHRLQHSSKWLWAEHELHHSDEHMNVTTGLRHHWLETVIQQLFMLTLTLLLFNPALKPMIWLVLFQRLMGYFIHLNSPIRFGWFNRILSSPQTHRIHHSKSPEHIDKNFATMLPIWDILFGTYYHPREDEWPATGVTGVKVTSLWQALVMPFVSWAKMLQRNRANAKLMRLWRGEDPSHQGRSDRSSLSVDAKAEKVESTEP